MQLHINAIVWLIFPLHYYRTILVVFYISSLKYSAQQVLLPSPWLNTYKSHFSLTQRSDSLSYGRIIFQYIYSTDGLGSVHYSFKGIRDNWNHEGHRSVKLIHVLQCCTHNFWCILWYAGFSSGVNSDSYAHLNV